MITSICDATRFSGGWSHRLGRMEAPRGRRSLASADRSGQQRNVGRCVPCDRPWFHENTKWAGACQDSSQSAEKKTHASLHEDQGHLP